MKISPNKIDKDLVSFVNFFNTEYRALIKAVNEFERLSEQRDELMIKKNAKEKCVRGAEKLEIEAKNRLDACARFIEELRAKKLRVTAEGERRAIDAQLSSAYSLFYNYYMMHEKAKTDVANAKTNIDRFVEVKEKSVKISLEGVNFDIANRINRVSMVAQVMEERYGVDLGVDKITEAIEAGKTVLVETSGLIELDPSWENMTFEDTAE